MEPLPANTSEYLRQYSDELGVKILAQFPPLHQPGNQVHPGVAWLRRTPFPAQELAIMGIVRQWERSNAAAAARPRRRSRFRRGRTICARTS